MPRRVLFLDRDGVINVDAGYVGTIDRFKFVRGIFPFLRNAQDLGYHLVVTTNQSGVARGLFSLADYTDLTFYMVDKFAAEGVCIDSVMGCFMHQDAIVDAFRGESFWRKPSPGMLLEIIQHMGVHPAHCAMIGDGQRDMKAALAASIGQCFWLSSEKNAQISGVHNVKKLNEIFLDSYRF